MEDLKSQLEKHPSYKGGGSVKKCATPGCGKTLKDDKFKYCFSCNEAIKAGAGAGGGMAHPAKLPDGYLLGGYFDVKNEKNYIKEDVFIKWAKDVSVDLKQQGLTSAAIRRFFSKLRAVEYKFKMNHDFDSAREGLFAFVRDVSYTENRSVTPSLFSRFIEVNIEQAKKDADHFRAFIEHFQSVVAYFKDK